jgi:hypothetical protein
MSYDNSIYDGVEFVAHDLENMRKQYERLRYETAILRAEVRAWRDADSRHDLTRLVMGDGNNDEVLKAMQSTDALGALNEENKR